MSPSRFFFTVSSAFWACAKKELVNRLAAAAAVVDGVALGRVGELSAALARGAEEFVLFPIREEDASAEVSLLELDDEASLPTE